MMKRYKQQSPRQSSESGFTLIESLVAIVVLSVLLIAVSPVIAFSVGMRAQARRLEIGSLAARAYVDAVRSCSNNAKNPICPLDPKIKQIDPLKVHEQPAPSMGTLTNCNDGKYCGNNNANLFCVDGDGNGTCEDSSLSDMLIQPIAANPTSTNSARGYKLLVRVYRADAFRSGAAPLKRAGQQSTVTNAIGNPSVPVAQVSTDIPPEGASFQDYCQRLNASGKCE